MEAGACHVTDTEAERGLGLRALPVGPPLLSEKSSNVHRLLRLELSDRLPTPTKTRNEPV
ncbi:uncharacterized protein N7477_003918 [Penicillium maclennaniae]|uniref:uncharacterized protein n=1 Tax=Penicillium maclennaniae TaxID=1343394 RepID=UPI002540F80C|nr:uncharacterized protein N7477_003918 [Penicillium maclennaniae]KAJ5678285.1 hypothetical protein N7477_003918 [Penicillium maclennaniae]